VIGLLDSILSDSLECPSWYAGRLWLLRVGYYKLTRPKDRADDWVWIVDHCVQLGPEKCFVILGLRLADLPAEGTCLSHEHVEPIALYPVKKSNGAIVYEQLEEAAQITGVPREIIADQGSDLKSGIEQFAQEHPHTCYVYDIKHKTAAILKHELEADEFWKSFLELTNQTKQRIQQTALAFLSPPNQRTQARYMNVDRLIEWGNKLLGYLDSLPHQTDPEVDLKQIEEKLGWIREFRFQLEEWGQILYLVQTAESSVRNQGLSRQSPQELEQLLEPLAPTERTEAIRQEILDFIQDQSNQANPNERLVGSSEVIESVFGKYKRIQHDQAKSGFTGLLLGISAMISKTTKEVVRKAIESVPTTSVLQWCKKKLGKTIQAKRKAALTWPQKSEQKWDQKRRRA